jgi:hypothetical protein
MSYPSSSPFVLKTSDRTITLGWRAALRDRSFRRALITGVILVSILLTVLAFFFGYVEQRQGVVLNDWVLAQIPAINVSYPLLFFIWSTVALSIYRATSSPRLFITFAYTYIVLCASRLLSMYLVPLDPPIGLIPITDPLSNILYGSKFITKDLFYSGHTATLQLLYLCLEKKKDRYFALFSTVCVAVLLLVQHVHYTIDVVTAPFFGYGCYWLGRKVLRTWHVLPAAQQV